MYLWLLKIFIIFYKIRNLFNHFVIRFIDFIHRFQHIIDPPEHILWSILYQSKTFDIFDANEFELVPLTFNSVLCMKNRPIL